MLSMFDSAWWRGGCSSSGEEKYASNSEVSSKNVRNYHRSDVDQEYEEIGGSGTDLQQYCNKNVFPNKKDHLEVQVMDRDRDEDRRRLASLKLEQQLHLQQQQQQQQQQQEEKEASLHRKLELNNSQRKKMEIDIETSVGKGMMGDDGETWLSQQIVERIAQFLTVREVAKLREVNKTWFRMVRDVPMYLNREFAPLELRILKKMFRKKGRWTIGGVRLMDGLPGDLSRILLHPEQLRFLQVSCLCLHKHPKVFELGMTTFKNLETLMLDDMLELESLQELAACVGSLKTLHIRRCSKLKDASIIRFMERLECLHICDCRCLSDLSFVSQCTNLRELVISGLDKVTNITPIIAHCKKLVRISITRCDQISCSHLDKVQHLVDLQTLVLEHLPEIVALPPNLRACRGLDTIIAASCPKLNDITGLSQCEKLYRVDISNTAVQELEPLSTLKALQYLDLSLCVKITDLEPLRDCKNLTALSLWRVPKLKNLFPLTFCSRLMWIDITGVPADSKIPISKVKRIVSGSTTNVVFAHRDKLFKVVF